MPLLVLLFALLAFSHSAQTEHPADRRSSEPAYGACIHASIAAGSAPTAIKVVIRCRAPARGDTVDPIVGGGFVTGHKAREGGIVGFRRRPVLRGHWLGSRFGKCKRYMRQINCSAKADGAMWLIEVIHVRPRSRCHFTVSIIEYDHSHCGPGGCPTSIKVREIAQGRPRGCR